MLELLQNLQVTLLHTGYAKLGPEWDFDNVISPFIRLFYVTKGSATVHHSNKTFHTKEGHMYLIPSYTYNRYKSTPYHEQYYISIFEEVLSGPSIFNMRTFAYEVPLQEGDELLFKRLVKMYPERKIVNSDPKSYVHRPQELMAQNRQNAQTNTSRFLETQGILYVLLSRFVKNVVPNRTDQSNDYRFANVLRYISENLHTQLRVQDLARLCHLNTDHFSRLFLQECGIRPLKYIQTRRIERAQLLLWTTNQTLEEIAHKVGMGNFSYFSKTFKKITGTTPGKYRKQQKITP
ncbi:AraC family transcriptional regulator [Pseudozobellia thermophila]|uniref:Transcriptional regulator, AraC family n=1 Tax=Pseudozobellia thermophila TaxID=192903 RepID=A0A1M6GI37_9FLAO|nr:AraC family transcriptional regulator [Pseudozobellia thermophila]SHJ09634.1 transcriptional regulator, AraC family [Pseudozobellia thermophila]